MMIVSKVVRLKGVILWCVLPPWRVTYDEIPDTESSAAVQEEESKITGKDRLILMFTRNEERSISPELNSCIHAGMTGLFIGAVYGGFIRSRAAYLDFFERNQATSFKSHLEAKRILQDHVTINFAKGAFSWGWRIAMFTSSFVLVSTVVSTYRGKHGIMDYVLAGGISGSLYRSNLGLRGMIVGGILGSALGTVGGAFIFAILNVAGITMEDILTEQTKWHDYRTDKEAQNRRDVIEEKSFQADLLKEREKNLVVGTSLDSLPQSFSTK